MHKNGDSLTTIMMMHRLPGYLSKDFTRTWQSATHSEITIQFATTFATSTM